MSGGGPHRSGGTLPSLNPHSPNPEIKETILINRPPARRKNRHRASILLSKDGFSRGKNTKATEEKLGEQFRYFRQEFLEAALSIGVPVPLDMVEDKAGRVYTFVNQKGPRYLFQIMHSNPESAHLLRVSLSLLIITLSILRGKLPQNNAISSSSNIDNTHLTWMNLLTENVSTWALDSLTNIADGSAVAICTNLLRHSHSQTIQELILNLLAQLVNITEEAANQMLLYPTIITTSSADQGGGGGGGGGGGKSHDGKDVESTNDNRSNSPLTVNRSIISNGSHDHSHSSFPKSKRQSFATSVSPPYQKNKHASRFHPNTASPSSSSLHSHTSHHHHHHHHSSSSNNYTCLSYMFSVVAHHRNRYTVMTASAEVVLALIANKSPVICEAIAKTSISPALVELSEQELRNTGSHNFGHTTISSRIQAVESEKKSKKTMSFSNSNSNSHSSQGTQWAALKLMLKFLQRFMRYATNDTTTTTTTTAMTTTTSASPSSPSHPHGTQKNSYDPASSPSKPHNGGDHFPSNSNSSPNSNNNNNNNTNTEDGLPHQQKSSLCHAHSRVLLAVCELIIYSPVVASYVLSMPGARAIVKSSCLLHQNSTEIGSSVASCLQVLQKESQRIYEQISSHRHSLSYELTHGRSSKLFNPVAVLAKRDGPSPRILSRPSTSSVAVSPGTTFGLPKTLQSQPSMQRILTARYSTSINPFTAEFSLPSSQPMTPHRDELDTDNENNHVDILFVHHDTEEEEEDEFDDEEGINSHENEQYRYTATASSPSPSNEQIANISQKLQRNQSNQMSVREEGGELRSNKISFNSFPVTNSSQGMLKKSVSVDSHECFDDDEDEEDNNHNRNNGKDWRNNPFDSFHFSLPSDRNTNQMNQNKEEKPSTPDFNNSFERQRIIYNPPESPPRRGLKEHQVGTNVSLHRDLFLTLPSKPAMPQRLEAHDIIHGKIPQLQYHDTPNHDNKFHYLDASMKQSLSISSSIVSSAQQTGYYVNGKCSMPIVEKARRVYSPSRPQTADKEFSTTSNSNSPNYKKQMKKNTSNIKSQYSSNTTPATATNRSNPLTSPTKILQDLKEPTLDEIEQLDNSSPDYGMFQNISFQSDPLPPSRHPPQPHHQQTQQAHITDPTNQYQKLSQGYHHDQILQSYEVLFP